MGMLAETCSCGLELGIERLLFFGSAFFFLSSGGVADAMMVDLGHVHCGCIRLCTSAHREVLFII
jgi:hypothetical protein